MPSRKTGLGQSSLTGLGNELAQNSDCNAVSSRRSVWPSVNGEATLKTLCCTAVSLR